LESDQQSPRGDPCGGLLLAAELRNHQLSYFRCLPIEKLGLNLPAVGILFSLNLVA
jgi:hypothetical protein